MVHYLICLHCGVASPSHKECPTKTHALSKFEGSESYNICCLCVFTPALRLANEESENSGTTLQDVPEKSTFLKFLVYKSI